MAADQASSSIILTSYIISHQHQQISSQHGSYWGGAGVWCVVCGVCGAN
jgi:hypothetical protein